MSFQILALLLVLLVRTEARPEPIPGGEGAHVGVVVLGADGHEWNRGALANVNEVLARCASLLQSSEAEEVKLVVFPEAATWRWGLTGAESTWRERLREYGFPAPQVGESLCAAHGHASQTSAGALFAGSMACLAAKTSIEIVFDTLTLEACDDTKRSACNADGYHLYNTAIALDNEGKVTAVYHKSHIFGTAPALDQPPTPGATSYFSRALQRHVGLMVCYDMDFYRPARNLFAQGIEMIVLPSDWALVPPLFSAAMMQQAWSRVHEIDLVASNLRNLGGAGIYSNGGVIASLPISPEAYNTDELVKAKLPPRTPTRARKHKKITNALQLSRRRPAEGAAAVRKPCAIEAMPQLRGAMCSTLIDHSAELSLNDGSFRCGAKASFSITKRTKAGTTADGGYVLFAFQGMVHPSHTPDPLHLSICAVIQCPSFSDAMNGTVECRGQLRGTLAADMVSLSASGIPTSATIYPMAAADTLSLLDPDATHFQTFNTSAMLTVALHSSQTLYSAVLYSIE